MRELRLRGRAAAARELLQHPGSLLQLQAPAGCATIAHQSDGQLRVTFRVDELTRCENFYHLHQLGGGDLLFPGSSGGLSLANALFDSPMNYQLRQLEAVLLKHVVEMAGPDHGRNLPGGTTQWGGFEIDVFHHVDDLNQADGISFLCPKCFPTEAQHSVHVYFTGRNVPDRLGKNKDGKTVRWTIAGGSGLDDLQLTPSILMQAEDGCQWHGFVGSSGIPPGHAG